MLNAALTLATRHGYQNVTRKQIADVIGVAESLVSHHFGTMANLRRALVRHAIAQECLVVVGQAIAARDPHARRVPPALKMNALQSL